MAQRSVRVRFAPSPTGFLHIGGLRTALFNLLFARHHQGTFLIRVEDTDLDRSRAEYTQAQLAALAWCDIRPDEPILFQSQRTELYRAIAEQLVAAGAAYRCGCTQEDMRARTNTGIGTGADSYYLYDGFCKSRTIAADTPHVIRIDVGRVMPEQCSFVDRIHGMITVPLETIDDFIIIRSNGMPMYNFAVVVDDWQMGITHVIRGDDHIINTPRQSILYHALTLIPSQNYPAPFPELILPVFAHIPLIVGKDGKKLSKRDASTATDDYRLQGILPQALTNYLVRLGWSHGDCEIIDRATLITLFSLDDVGKKAATFDIEKLLWVNSVYIKESSIDTLDKTMAAIIDPAWRTACSLWSDAQIDRAIELYQSRVKTVRELYTSIVACAQGPVDPQSLAAPLRPEQREALSMIAAQLIALTPYSHDTLKALLADIRLAVAARTETTLTMADIAMPIRMALTGSSAAPGIIDLLLLFGPEVSRQRITALL